MSTVVDIRKADDPRDVIHQAVQLLAEGKLVALPTDTVYVVSAFSLKPEAVEKWRTISPDAPEPSSVLALKGAEEALDFVPEMSALGRRLTRRGWPGPLTILFDVGRNGLIGSLPNASRKAVQFQGAIPYRVSAHPIIAEILRFLPGPLVLSTETPRDEFCMTSAASVQELFGDAVDLIIDHGPARSPQPSTMVHVADEHLRVLRQGLLTPAILNRLSSRVYLFVCTGNTCRSPMAEALFRKSLAERVQCSPEKLAEHGYVVASAGLAAAEGAPAAAESVEILLRHKIDLSGHMSQPVTEGLLDQAERIYTMTQSQRASILASRPDLVDRVRVLQQDGRDIPDPVGCGLAEYEACEREIQLGVRAIIDELELV